MPAKWCVTNLRPRGAGRLVRDAFRLYPVIKIRQHPLGLNGYCLTHSMCCCHQGKGTSSAGKFFMVAGRAT